MSLAISKERKEEIVQSTRRFFAEKLEIDLSEVQAGFLIEYFFREIAPLAYNQGGGGRAEVPDQASRGLARNLLSRAPDILGSADPSHGVRRKPQR
jgi:uncharacterized protein (DUF2164 family)